jgi:hypothetical protein
MKRIILASAIAVALSAGTAAASDAELRELAKAAGL